VNRSEGFALRLPLALTAALLLAGCGGTSAPSAPSGPANSTASAGAPGSAAAGSAAAQASSGAAAGSPAAQSGAAGTATKLNVWDGSSTLQAPIYIGLERGYFKQQGLDLQTVAINGALDAQVPQLANGQLDVGGGAFLPGLVNAVGRGIPVRLVAVGAIHTPGRSQLIVARKDVADSGQLKTYADLKGKTIARPAQLGIVTIAVEKALQMGGLNPSDVTWLEIQQAVTIAAVANKKVDLAYLSEPFATQSIDQGVAVKWHEMSDLVPKHVASTWVYGSRVINNPDLGRRFMLAYMRGVRDYEDAFGKNKDRDAIVSIMVKHTAIKDPAMFGKMQAIDENAAGEFPMDTLQQDYDWFKSQGAIQQPAPVLTQIVDPQFVDYAIQQLGPYK
jgi:ABC-type nitrate/sulfonate/bicarbonate transport system substrate-binding protein